MGKHKKKSKKHRKHSDSSDEWEETKATNAETSRSKTHSKMRKPVEDYAAPSDLAPSRRHVSQLEISRTSAKKDQPSWRKQHCAMQSCQPKSEKATSVDQTQMRTAESPTVRERDQASVDQSSGESLPEQTSYIRIEKRDMKSPRTLKSREDYVVQEDSRRSSSIREAKTDDIKLQTSQTLSNDEMNKLSAKILKAELRGDTETAQRLKTKLELAACARTAAEQDAASQQDETTVIVVTTDKPHLPDRNKRSLGKSEKRSDKKKMRVEDTWQSLENKFVRKKMEDAEDTNAVLQRAKRRMEAGSSQDPTQAVDEDSAAEREASDPLKRRLLETDTKSNTDRHHCPFCVDSPIAVKQVIHSGENVIVMLPQNESIADFHCLIVPKEHFPALTQADEDTWSEIQKLRKVLTELFEAEEMDCVFLQTVTEMSRRTHALMHCVPVPRESAEIMPMYFKKAIEECETEWTLNRKLVRLSKEGVRASIPKGLPYFAVDFGEQNGFAHVIEDRLRFPEYFGLEIVGSVLGVKPSTWLRPRKESFQDHNRKVVKFEKVWLKHDCDKKARHAK